jgi:nucleoside-diphosphate-sugar epimerase
VRHSQADIGRAREALGYNADVSFAEGLRRVYEDTLAADGEPTAPGR